MHDESQILGYQPGSGFIYQLNATTKLVFMLLVSAACMITYDTRFLVAIGILSIYLFKEANIKWRQISFIVKFIVAFMILNLLFVYLFQPTYGENIYHSKSILIHAGYFTLTIQEVFYLFNLFLKYVCSIPVVLLFLLTTNPSQFAASLNRIGISYKISYAVHWHCATSLIFKILIGPSRPHNRHVVLNYLRKLNYLNESRAH